MEDVQAVLVKIKQILDFPLFHLGKSEFTAWGIFLFLALLLLLFAVTARLKQWIADRLLARSHLDLGGRMAVAGIVRYLFLGLGFLVILQTAGIDLSSFTILVGSLGIGIGLGLQNITTNFVSGLILLLERPVKVGDRIEFGNLSGDVVSISARATRIITNDNIAVIVPNSELISSPVINWSSPTRNVRFNFPVAVSYGTDPELVRNILLEIAENHNGVLKQPVPDVLLDRFGDSSIDFTLRLSTVEYANRPNVLKSEINYAIAKKFIEQGIEMPFSQHEIHIKDGALQLKSPPN